MHGLGNDYVYVNCFEEQLPDEPSVLARAISDRHRGVGSDGLILILPSRKADVRMEIYNADGSRAEMCGNGIRCVAKYAYEHGLIRRGGQVLGPMAGAEPPPSPSVEQLHEATQDQEGQVELVLEQDEHGQRLSGYVGGAGPSAKRIVESLIHAARLGKGPVRPGRSVRLRTQADVLIETDAGVRPVGLFIENERVVYVCVDMGRPSLMASDLRIGKDPEALAAVGLTDVPDRIVDFAMRFDGQPYRVTCVSVGNPHAVVFVDDLDAIDLAGQGRAIETAPIFRERINVHFVRVNALDDVAIRTWERGSGATLACGSGATAVCVAGAVTGRTSRHVTAHLPGGDCWLRWADDDHVYLTGPAEEVFTGDWPAAGCNDSAPG